MRRARARQDYAKRNDTTARPFGGVNLRFCGDFLQLPPVKALGLYSNPFTTNMEFVEQRTMNYVWRHTDDSTNGLCELTITHRQKDPWLAHVLREHREGAETWETYCFVHGLPTKHAGSWLPQSEILQCGHASCEELAKKRWQEGTPWHSRGATECDLCETERLRRCRVVLPTNHNANKHKEMPFIHAPYIHPFNAPKYNAQLLRSVKYAKGLNKRLLWVRAFDLPLAEEDKGLNVGDLERRRRQWLQIHDKKTGGIMGLMPLVHDLPMRLTDTKDPSKHAFKNAKVRLDGWCLTESEAERIANTDDPEIVLFERPTYIRVRIIKARMKAGEKPETLLLKPQAVIWSRDRQGYAKVKRIGFPLVPEFGGTVHAYCGSTLEATQSDLLEWHRRPTPEDMQRAYINESRVRIADNLLIMQPYSPELFRQGQLPGPKILLQVLRGTMRPKQAQAAWEQVEAERQHRAATPTVWPYSMLLPCRGCTLQNGEAEVRLPLKAFTTATKIANLWQVLAQGQDLACIKCQQTHYWGKKQKQRHEVQPETGPIHRMPEMEARKTILCDTCLTALWCTAFSSKMQMAWENDPQSFIQCNSCATGGQQINKSDLRFFYCTSCNHEWPETAFIQNARVANKLGVQTLLELQDKDHLHMLTCASCLTRETDLANAEKECVQCKRKMHIRGPSNDGMTGWAPSKIHQYLHLKHSGKSSDSIRQMHWVCYNCQYPKCDKCLVRPKFYTNKYNLARRLCEQCRDEEEKTQTCFSCKAVKPSIEFTKAKYTCNECELKKEAPRYCTGCEKEKPGAEFPRKGIYSYEMMAHCRSCLFPTCCNCNTEATTIVRNVISRKGKRWYRYQNKNPTDVQI